MMKNTLICTVGTSLLGNLRRDKGELGQAFDRKNWNEVNRLLLQRNNTDRACGAEINSIARICDRGIFSSRIHLIFLVSDTDDGLRVGKLLQMYYESRENPDRFDEVRYQVLEGLKDNDPNEFATKGLKNLVVEISRCVRSHSAETIAINATGGYKAQISFAGTIGQALEIPVYYLFEGFSEIIELPPQPIALNLEFWLKHYSLFEHCDREGEVEKDSLDFSDVEPTYIQALFDEAKIDGTTYVALSATGLLFHERSRLQFNRQNGDRLACIPEDDTEPEQKKVSISNHHGNHLLQQRAKRVCQSKWVKGIRCSLDWTGKRKNKNPILKVHPDGTVDFALTETDEGFSFKVQTTGRNLEETQIIALALAERYFDWKP